MSKKKSSPLKLVGIVFGSLFGLFFLAAIIVPLVVDVDKYRPTIVSKANEMLNGKLELGKLGLSLWGRVKIDIDGLKLTDAKGATVVEVKDAGLNIPLLSVLMGHPELRVHMVSPVINVVKQKDGKLNVMSLMKETPAGAGGGAAQGGAPTTTGKGTAAPSGGAVAIPAMALNSRITILLDHAKVDYKDSITGDNYAINDLNFRLEDVSPSSNMPFEVTANLDLTVQHKIKVTGPLVFDGEVKARSSGGAFESATAKADVKLDGLEIVDPGLFHKAKGVALGAELEATVGKDSFDVPKMKFRLADVTIDGKASGKTAGGATSIDFKAHSNKIDITKLGDLSPLVKEYNLNGLIEVAVSASGPTDKLGYACDLKFNKISLNHESMKQPIEVNGSLAVVTNALKDLNVKLTAKDFDLRLDGSVQNFSAARFKFNLASNVMDLDGLLKASAKAAETRKEHAEAAKSGGGGDTSPGAAPVVDYNAMLKPLHENPMFAAVGGTFDFNLKKIKSTGVVIDNFKGQLALNNLLLALKDFSMGIFDGAIKGNMSFNARSAKPEVATNVTVTGLQTKAMVESQMPIARNTIKGAISAGLNIGGSGLNQSDIIANWKGNGSMEIKDAVFSTLDIGRQIKDGVLDKLPGALKGKVNIPDALISKQGQYDTVNTKFALNNGVLNISEINGKAHPNQGLDLKGNGTVKLANYGLDLNLDIIDTYNMLHLDDEVKDKRYGHFTLSPKVGCTLFATCFDWGSTIGKLAQSALEQQGKKALQKAIGDKVPGIGNIFGGGNSGGNNGGGQPAQNPADNVKKAFKGLFGH